MSSALTFLILLAPFALAATLIWAARRSGTLRLHRDQFRIAAPMGGRLFDGATPTHHDPDDIRARFEQQPVWPSSGATGERR
ncbi:MAG: hypothetical protein WA944_08885 [Mycobacterium sp.]